MTTKQAFENDTKLMRTIVDGKDVHSNTVKLVKSLKRSLGYRRNGSIKHAYNYINGLLALSTHNNSIDRVHYYNHIESAKSLSEQLPNDIKQLKKDIKLEHDKVDKYHDFYNTIANKARQMNDDEIDLLTVQLSHHINRVITEDKRQAHNDSITLKRSKNMLDVMGIINAHYYLFCSVRNGNGIIQPQKPMTMKHAREWTANPTQACNLYNRVNLLAKYKINYYPAKYNIKYITSNLHELLNNLTIFD